MAVPNLRLSRGLFQRARRHQRAGAIAASSVALTLDLLVWAGQRDLRFGGEAPLWLVPAALVALYVPILLGRAGPWTALVAFAAFGVVAGLAIPTYAPFPGLALSLFRLVSRSSLRRALAGAAVAAVSLTVNAINSVSAIGATPQTIATSILVWLMIGVIPWTAGRLWRLNAEQAERRHREVASAALRAERVRIARELHDIVSHSVGAIILQAAGARKLSTGNEPQVVAALTSIETTGVEAMRELHRLLGLLRAVDDTELPEPVQLETLTDAEQLLAAVRTSGVEARWSVEGEPQPTDPSVEHTAYRVVQECLANVLKHAGRGAEVDVKLKWQSTQLVITVRNTAGRDSVTDRQVPGGFGTAGLRERLDAIGGSFAGAPTPNGGYLAQAVLPLFGAAASPASASSSPASSGPASPARAVRR